MNIPIRLLIHRPLEIIFLCYYWQLEGKTIDCCSKRVSINIFFTTLRHLQFNRTFSALIVYLSADIELDRGITFLKRYDLSPSSFREPGLNPQRQDDIVASKIDLSRTKLSSSLQTLEIKPLRGMLRHHSYNSLSIVEFR